MGPFSYIPFMECNHAILSMENTAQGCININQDKIYNGSKIQEYDSNRHLVNITLKRGRYSLNIKAKKQEELKLTAPIKGKMEKEIFESISSVATVTLKRKDKVIFCDTSTNCGLEIVE